MDFKVDKSIKGTVVNQRCLPVNQGSLEITIVKKKEKEY